jgi:hypothetical protein
VIELLSVPLKNRPGQLHAVVVLIAQAGVEIKALSLMHHGPDNAEVLLLVTNLARARQALESAGRGYSLQPALVVEVSDSAGGLALVLEATMTAGLSINDLFYFVSRVEGKALAVATFDDAEHAAQLLRQAGVGVVDQKTIAGGAGARDAGPYLLDDYLGGSFFW